MPQRCVTLRGLTICAPPSRCQRGFSLLELLVALTVVVLVTTLVNLNVGSGGQEVQLRALVHEFAGTASYALDEAQTTGVDYGLLLEEEQQAGETFYSINWLEHRIDGWAEPLSGKEVFAKQRLPEGITLDIELEDSLLPESSQEDNADRKERKHGEDPEEDENTIQPQVIFYASGETTVGAINVRQAQGGDLLWRVEWDLLGRFKVLPRGEEVDDSDEQEEDR